jgi:hypothetical protein
MGIIGVDGKLMTTKQVEVAGYKFDVEPMQNNPFLMLMALICIDPTEKQRELLEKMEVVFMDSNGKQMFPFVEEEKKEES